MIDLQLFKHVIGNSPKIFPSLAAMEKHSRHQNAPSSANRSGAFVVDTRLTRCHFHRAPSVFLCVNSNIRTPRRINWRTPGANKQQEGMILGRRGTMQHLSLLVALACHITLFGVTPNTHLWERRVRGRKRTVSVCSSRLIPSRCICKHTGIRGRPHWLPAGVVWGIMILPWQLDPCVCLRIRVHANQLGRL